MPPNLKPYFDFDGVLARPKACVGFELQYS